MIRCQLSPHIHPAKRTKRLDRRTTYDRSRSLLRHSGDLFGANSCRAAVFQRHAMALRHSSPRKKGKMNSKKKWAVVRCLVFACAVFFIYFYISYGYAVMTRSKVALSKFEIDVNAASTSVRGHLLRGKAVLTAPESLRVHKIQKPVNRVAVIQHDVSKVTHKSLNWIPIDYKIVSYYKKRPRLISESREWFHWIVENYDNLPDYVVFLHGHSASWHTHYASYSAVASATMSDTVMHYATYYFYRIRQNYFDTLTFLGLNGPSPYIEVDDVDYIERIKSATPSHIQMLSRYKWTPDNFDPRNANLFLHGHEKKGLDWLSQRIWGCKEFKNIWFLNTTETSRHRCCLESIVSKEAILQWPRAMYVDIEKQINKWSYQPWAWINERIWQFIFLKNSNLFGKAASCGMRSLS